MQFFFLLSSIPSFLFAFIQPLIKSIQQMDGCAEAGEKSLDILAIKGNEISFKFPIDDRVCTIDELVPPSPPPPPRCKAPITKE